MHFVGPFLAATETPQTPPTEHRPGPLKRLQAGVWQPQPASVPQARPAPPDPPKRLGAVTVGYKCR